MHDKLIPHQDELTPSDLERYAAELGLDDRRFWQQLRQATHADRIAEDVASADASGVAGTPGFFTNGQRQDSGYDIATLTAGVRAARGRAASTRHT